MNFSGPQPVLAGLCACLRRVFPVFFSPRRPGCTEELTGAFAVSGTTLGALAATYFYLYSMMQVPTGVLVDTLGPRRVLTAGGVIAGVGSIIFGGAESVAAAAVGRSLTGLGVSVAFVCLLKLNASWFDDRRLATLSGFGNVIGVVGALFIREAHCRTIGVENRP